MADGPGVPHVAESMCVRHFPHGADDHRIVYLAEAGAG